MTEPCSKSGVQQFALHKIYTRVHTAETVVLEWPLRTQSLIAQNTHLINSQDLGNKAVNPLLTVSVAQQEWLHIMQDNKRDAGWLHNSNRPHGAHGLCQPDS